MEKVFLNNCRNPTATKEKTTDFILQHYKTSIRTKIKKTSAIFNRQKVNIEKYVFKKGLRI